MKTLLMAAGLMLLAGSVAAQTQVRQEPDHVVPAKKTKVDMSEIEIGGTVVKPTVTPLTGRTRTKFRTLIEVRGNFHPELAATVPAL